MNKDQQFQELLDKAKNDPRVVGLILTGGRGKDSFTEHSDYDLLIIATDEGIETAKTEYKKFNSIENIELGISTLTELKNKGTWGAEDSWASYGLTHSKVQIDTTGEIQGILDAKEMIPEDKIQNYVDLWIGGFLNQYYRVFKNHRDGNTFAAHLDAVESIPMLLSVLFGREGRIRPYNKFLEWELRTHPLKETPWPVEEFITKIHAVLETGDMAAMKDFYKKLRDSSLRLGYDEVIKGWDGYVLE